MWPRWYNPPVPARMPLSDMLRFIADHYGVTVAELRGAGRCPALVGGRSVAARILRDRGLSYPTIARLLGKRDHTTIMHLVSTFHDRARKYPEITMLYNTLRVNESERLAA